MSRGPFRNEVWELSPASSSSPPPPPPEEPLLLTREQAAALCNVSLDILDSWSQEPGFPVIRRPRFVRVHRQELDLWLRQQAIATNPPEVVEVMPPLPARRPRRQRRA
jgi:hypothetical protein